MHSVLRNEAGHVRSQRSDRLVYLHTLAQEVAVLSNSGLVDDVFGQGGLLRFVEVGSYVSTILRVSVARERVVHAVFGVSRHADASTRFSHLTGKPYTAQVPLSPLQANVPLAVVCNETQLHVSVDDFLDESPERPCSCLRQ